MLRDELFREMVEAFKEINNAKNLFDFQSYLKGENYLMSRLESLGGVSKPGNLAKELGVSKPRIAAMLCSLERKKLIKRSISKDDKRSSVIVITDKGREWVKLAGNEVHHAVLGVIEKIGEEDTKEFIRIMKKLLLIDQNEKKNAEEKEGADLTVVELDEEQKQPLLIGEENVFSIDSKSTEEDRESDREKSGTSA